MKQILFLPSWYPSRLDIFNGDFIQRHAQALSLFRPVHVVYIVRDKKRLITDSLMIEENQTGDLTETIIYYSGRNYNVGFIDRLASIREYDRLYREYFSKEQAKNISSVHVHVPYKAGLIALLLKKTYDLDFYVTEHWTGYDKTIDDNFFLKPPSYRFITKKILRNAKYVAPVSKDLAAKLLSVVQGVKTKVIPNVVNEKLFYFEEKIPNVFRFIHYVSYSKGQKNTEGLINVFSELNKIRQDWECIMYGPVQDELKGLITKFSLKDRVIFTGEIPYKKVADIVRSASVFVSFSNYENQPCSILEALCCGLPVIATRVGGIPEIIAAHNGILIEPNNEAQLLLAINTIMNNWNDYDRREIACNAKSKYSYEVVGKQLSLLYDS